jgi:hypothetical protein
VYAGFYSLWQDHIFCYHRDIQTGELTLLQRLDKFAYGLNGIRDLQISADGRFLYVVNNMNSSIVVLERDHDSGLLKLQEKLVNHVDGVEGLGRVEAIEVSPDNRHLYAVSLGDKGLLTFSREADIIPALLPDSSQFETGTQLFTNYPNPFNVETTIRFEMIHGSTVNIQIYDMLGRKIRTLVQEFYETGHYAVTWDGRNKVGIPVASGVYIYRLAAGNFVESRKMLLLR